MWAVLEKNKLIMFALIETVGYKNRRSCYSLLKVAMKKMKKEPSLCFKGDNARKKLKMDCS